jgi:hypothetical protein
MEKLPAKSEERGCSAYWPAEVGKVTLYSKGNEALRNESPSKVIAMKCSANILFSNDGDGI